MQIGKLFPEVQLRSIEVYILRSNLRILFICSNWEKKSIFSSEENNIYIARLQEIPHRSSWLPAVQIERRGHEERRNRAMDGSNERWIHDRGNREKEKGE
jgi:hypothetical protein